MPAGKCQLKMISYKRSGHETSYQRAFQYEERLNHDEHKNIVFCGFNVIGFRVKRCYERLRERFLPAEKRSQIFFPYFT